MLIARPKWQDEFAEKASEELESKVLEADAEFKRLLDEKLSKAQPGFYGTATQAAMDATHRLEVLSGIGPDGNYEARIDYLLHTIWFSAKEE